LAKGAAAHDMRAHSKKKKDEPKKIMPLKQNQKSSDVPPVM